MNTIRFFLFLLCLFFSGNSLFAYDRYSLVFSPVITECGKGNALISITKCLEDGAFGGAQLDHVTWNMGDGTPTFETADMSVNYAYMQSGTYQVTAFATFFFPNGVSYEVQVYSSCSDHSATYSYHVVHIFMMTGFLSLAPTGPVIANVPYDVKLNYSGDVSALNGLSHQLFLDGVLVPSISSFPASGSTISTLQFTEGQHVLEYVFTQKEDCSFSIVLIIEVQPPPPPCSTCFTFKPEPGMPYWVSAWVKEEHSPAVMNYNDAFVEIEFVGSTSAPVNFHTTGEIIDGWQRIVGEFVIPAETTDLNIYLSNTPGTGAAYFDDVRIHPFNASMKSYVYDPVTFLLTAELDDNNYATFYEYDKEGQLIRIKKETARGIMTIQESRSNNPKN